MDEDKHTDNIIYMLATIRKLESNLLAESDPRAREEIALTLDMLTPAFDRMVLKYAKAHKKIA